MISIMVRTVPLLLDMVYHTPRCTLIRNIFSTARTHREKVLLEDVINYLLLAHKDQYRKGDTYQNPNNPDQPLKYLCHIYMVWVQAYLEGRSFAEQVALLFHDTVEDGVKHFHPDFGKTRAKIRQDIWVICSQLGQSFADEVLSHIDALTNKEDLAASDKETWQLNHFKQLDVCDQNNKLRDKFANMWDSYRNPPSSWGKEKLQNDMAFALKMLTAAKNPPNYITILLTDLAKKFDEM